MMGFSDAQINSELRTLRRLEAYEHMDLETRLLRTGRIAHARSDGWARARHTLRAVLVRLRRLSQRADVRRPGGAPEPSGADAR
jgi:hypothetical protein